MTRGTPGLRPALTDPQDRRPVCFCKRCGGELYDGEVGYTWQGQQICPDCFNTVIIVWLEESAHEVATALGVETQLL